MLWGNGDTSRLDGDQVKTLSDLRRMVETGHIISLTPDQSAAMLRALRWYEMWESSLKLLSSMRNTAILVGFLVTIWAVTEGTILEFLQGRLQ